MHPDLTLALALADAADAITLERFRATDLVVETKPDMTPVSEADRAAEVALREMLAVERPDHGIVGEEFGAQAGGASARWILDPIDGTKNYVRGVPVFATLIGLERDGEVELGVVSAPALGRRWWAARGNGAFADGQPIRVSSVRDLGDAHVSHGCDWAMTPGVSALAARCWRTRGFADFWQHVLVAEGALDIAIDPEVSVWDVAAVQVVVEEAGGRLTTLGGDRRPDGGSAVSTNGLVHDATLAVLRHEG